MTKEEIINGIDMSRAARNRYIAYFPDGDYFVNLAGQYNYLETPYYISQDLESQGKEIHPNCKESLDAYIAPLFLEKARLAGLPVPSHYITNGFFEPPVIVDTINPFMQRTRFVRKAGRQVAVARSLTRNFTYAVCCQEIPPGAKVRYFRSVLGWCSSPGYRELSKDIWRTFKIPLARVRILVTPDDGILFSSIEPILLEKLNSRELTVLQGKISWPE